MSISLMKFEQIIIAGFSICYPPHKNPSDKWRLCDPQNSVVQSRDGTSLIQRDRMSHS